MKLVPNRDIRIVWVEHNARYYGKCMNGQYAFCRDGAESTYEWNNTRFRWQAYQLESFFIDGTWIFVGYAQDPIDTLIEEVLS